MSYTVAAIDVHQKLLVVAVADAAQPDVTLQTRRFRTGAAELHHLACWLEQLGVTEAAMESTAQYCKPVWMELEPGMRLHLAQAQSNRAPKGRKTDFGDAKRLLKRLVAGELMLSFVPGPEQRAWRMVTRGRLPLVRERVHLQNQIESLLEEGRIKLSSAIRDLLGVSGRRIPRAMAKGEGNLPDRLEHPAPGNPIHRARGSHPSKGRPTLHQPPPQGSTQTWLSDPGLNTPGDSRAMIFDGAGSQTFFSAGS